nr:DNA adenine methylase [Actinomycetota bacterium]
MGEPVKPPINYYGGKARLAPRIAALFPPHRVYLEVFYGSAAVLFAKRPAPHEVLNDLDSCVVSFFSVLRERPDDLVRACRLTPYAREEFAAAGLTDPSVDQLELARRFFVRLTQGFNKTIATDPRSVGWSASVLRGSNNARTAANLVERFHQCAERLRHVTIECRPAVECIEAYAVADGVVYADPPYLAGTRASLAKRVADYSVEYNSEADHRELAAVLCASPATVFLSGYHSALYDELYGDWHRVERRVLVSASNQAGASRHAVEVVRSNRPIACQLRFDGEPGALAAGECPAPQAGDRTASG